MKRISLIMTGLMIALASTAQEDSTNQIEPVKTTLTLGATYANNASYYGQRPIESTPYAALVASLKFPSGIYFTGLGYRLLKDSSSAISAGSLGAGIEIKMGKNWLADLSYSHTFYPSNSPFLQASTNNIASGTLTYNYWLSSSVNVDYAFGTDEDVFATFNTNKLIPLGHLFSPKDGIAITPAIDITGGTQHFYKNYITKKILRDNVIGFPVPPVFGGGTTTESDTTTTTETRFDLISYSFKLPVQYYRAHYLIEAAYQVAKLSDKAQVSPGSTNSFFTLSFYYQF